MAKSRKPSKSAISMPDEREIDETKQTVPVSRAKISKRARQPIANAAVVSMAINLR